MVTFVPGFITCNSSNLGTVQDAAGRRNRFFYQSSPDVSIQHISITFEMLPVLTVLALVLIMMVFLSMCR